MSSIIKSDQPAAKVALKVPLPDSLVEVRVSPPESNFEIKVSPGDDVIELLIRPGSSFVEVRISPPGDSAAKARLEAEEKAGETKFVFPAETAPAPRAEQPDLAQDTRAGAPEAPAEALFEAPVETPAASPALPQAESADDFTMAETLAEPSLEELLGDEPLIWTAQVNEPEAQAFEAGALEAHELEADEPEAPQAPQAPQAVEIEPPKPVIEPYEASDLPDTRLAAAKDAADDEDGEGFAGGLFINVLDQDESPAEDESLFPSVAGPRPEDLVNSGRRAEPAQDEEDEGPRFIDVDEVADDTDYWPPEEEGPAFGTAGSAAKVALARLSAAVEKERAAAETVEVESQSPAEDFAPPVAPEVFGPADESIIIDPRTSVEALGARLAVQPMSAAATFTSPYKMPAADATVMVQLYDDFQPADPAAETATPLSEEDQFEISPMDDELAIGPIDVEGLDDIDLEKSQLPKSREAQTVLRARPLNTVIPGNTIVPE